MNLRTKKGFTLIEVVIVLAIAALILIIVFLAVAGAQRGRRDEANAQAAGRLVAAMEQYASNNGGTFAVGALTGEYISNIKDSAGGNPTYHATNAATTTSGNRLVYSSGSVCDSNLSAARVAGNATNVSVSYWSESAGAASCKDNK